MVSECAASKEWADVTALIVLVVCVTVYNVAKIWIKRNKPE